MNLGFIFAHNAIVSMIVCRPFLNQALNARALLDRLRSSTVVWSWIYNGARLASGIILLPLVLRKLPEAELGMYYVLLVLAPLVAGSLFNYWYWPAYGVRTLGTSVVRFLFRSPPCQAADPSCNVARGGP